MVARNPRRASGRGSKSAAALKRLRPTLIADCAARIPTIIDWTAGDERHRAWRGRPGPGPRI